MQDISEPEAQELASHFRRPQISGEYDFGQLPVELVQEVIARVQSTRDLYNLCLVCKRFNQWSTPQLYRSVFLSSAEHILRFSALLARLPDLGRVVRELWMFRSVVSRDEEQNDEWSDETGSSWTSSDNDSIGSSSGDSDLEEQIENMDIDSEFDDVNVPVHDLNFGLAALIFPPEEFPQRPATIPSSSHPYSSVHMHDDTKVWMDYLYPVVTPSSIVYAHACAILSACTSLESLYLPWAATSFNIYSSSCLHALSPCTRLRELAIYKAPDLWHSGFSDPSHFRYTSNVRRLTILDTMFHHLPAELPDIFPYLTHLRISLHIFDDMVSCLSRFKALTHLWFAPPEGDWTERVDLENFFQDLHIQCPNIKRVRVDIPFGSYDAPQSFGVANWNLFKFVSVKSSVMRDTNSMWVYDLEVPFRKHSSGDGAPYLYNAYTSCLEYYWKLRLRGGGWDD